MSEQYRQKRKALIQCLLAAGAEVNTADCQGTTPLMLAAIFDPDEDSYEEIGKSKTPPLSPDAYNSDWPKKNKKEPTGGWSQDWDLNSEEDTWSENVAIMRMLLARGADVHLADSQGETALHKAAFCSESPFPPPPHTTLAYTPCDSPLT